MHVLFTEDGEMDKRVFLATWKDIPVQNEVQYEITNVQHNAGLFWLFNTLLFIPSSFAPVAIAFIPHFIPQMNEWMSRV